MKIEPTLEGGLRLDMQTPIDWLVLLCISADARGSSTELADRLNEYMTGEEGADDWREFVLPDLRAQFDSQITAVEDSLKTAAEGYEDGEPQQVVIHPADGERWFGALNQARLALADRYGFDDEEDPSTFTPGKSMAWVRYNFYARIQYPLLRYVMR